MAHAKDVDVAQNIWCLVPNITRNLSIDVLDTSVHFVKTLDTVSVPLYSLIGRKTLLFLPETSLCVSYTLLWDGSEGKSMISLHRIHCPL